MPCLFPLFPENCSFPGVIIRLWFYCLVSIDYCIFSKFCPVSYTARGHVAKPRAAQSTVKFEWNFPSSGSKATSLRFMNPRGAPYNVTFRHHIVSTWVISNTAGESFSWNRCYTKYRTLQTQERLYVIKPVCWVLFSGGPRIFPRSGRQHQEWMWKTII